MRCYVGTSGWSFPHWKGILYPEELSPSDWLKYYSSNFNCVEVNSTFYRSFSASTYQKWANSVHEDFKFILKLPQEITHKKRLAGARNEILGFLDGLSLIAGKVGLILMQLPPSYKVVLSDFEESISLIREKFPLAVEFRNRYAFSEDVLDILVEYNCCFVNPDSPNSNLQTLATNDILYLRLHGRRAMYKSSYTDNELEELSDILFSMRERIKSAYVIFNNGMEGFSIPNAFKFIELIGNKSKELIIPLHRHSPELGL